MAVYKFITLVGTSETSWEAAAKNAVEEASMSLDDVRVAEVEMLDLKIEAGRVVAYRAKVNISFKIKEKINSKGVAILDMD